MWSNSFLTQNPGKISENLSLLLSKQDFDQLPTKDQYVETPLVYLETFSKALKKPVYLKDESKQRGGSFKFRGVFYQVYKTLDQIVSSYFNGNPQEKIRAKAILEKGIKIVTQSTGNHGINTIHSTLRAVEFLKEKYKETQELVPWLNKVEPIIFTSLKISFAKKKMMQANLDEYQNKICQHQGKILGQFANYHQAFLSREKFIQEEQGCAFYMAHADKDIMLGHGSMALEIYNQLEKIGFSTNIKSSLIFPVGAGGPLGIGAYYKFLNPNGINIAVQSKGLESLVKVLSSIPDPSKLGPLDFYERMILDPKLQNPEHQSPTVYLTEQGDIVSMKEDGASIYFPDGISVDKPEAFSIPLALNSLDYALVIDDQLAFTEAALLLYLDLLKFYGSPDEAKVGGTTALTAQAILEALQDKNHPVHQSEVIVLVGTEGTIVPEISLYQAKNQAKTIEILNKYLQV